MRFIAMASVEASPSFADIAAYRKTATDDTQWDAYATGLTGKRADGWMAEVVEVTPSDGRYSIRLDLEPESATSTSFATVMTEDSAAATLKPGQAAIVTGILKRVSSPQGALEVEFEDGASVTGL
jgi:hypothetical protein